MSQNSARFIFEKFIQSWGWVFSGRRWIEKSDKKVERREEEKELWIDPKSTKVNQNAAFELI